MTAKRQARLWAAAILAIAGISANSGYTGHSGYAEAAAFDDPVDQGALRAVLPDATLRAQASFEQFLNGAMGRHQTAPEAAVRIRKDDTPVWLFNISETDTGFVGQPAGTKGNIAFDRGDVIDWSYAHRDGRMHGNFGARAMMEVLPAHRAALIATTLSLDPIPTGW